MEVGKEIDNLVDLYNTTSFNALFREAWIYIERVSVNHRDIGALYMSMLTSPEVANKQKFEGVIYTFESFRAAILSA